MARGDVQRLIERDGPNCKICGRPCEPTIDHIIPKSKGGSNHLSNKQIACRICNEKKADKMPDVVPPFDSPQWAKSTSPSCWSPRPKKAGDAENKPTNQGLTRLQKRSLINRRQNLERKSREANDGKLVCFYCGKKMKWSILRDDQLACRRCGAKPSTA